jgi:deoxyribodipyrimidine photo-lyase
MKSRLFWRASPEGIGRGTYRDSSASQGGGRSGRPEALRMTTILWFRRDLRLEDNPALAAALARGGPVLPVYVRDQAEGGARAPGGASNWWLHGSLEALDESLRRRGSRLILRSGPAEQVIGALAHEVGASGVVWSRCHEPWADRRDARLKATLSAGALEVYEARGRLLHNPAKFRTQAGGSYQVFSPFWRALRSQLEAPPAIPAPDRLEAPPPAATELLADWELRPSRPDWAGGLRATWTPGEDGALERLDAFVDRALFAYHDARNRPDLAGTSRLSPHLHFGEVGPWQVWRAVQAAAVAETGDPWAAGPQSYLSEIAWREFAYHLLHHAPDLTRAPMRPQFANFPWRDDEAGLEAWRRGRTGYPIVDAGLRELWTTGWMHNRVRMIVASFLVKDLLVDWRQGEAWFWDTLVDADVANNAVSWQWVAGSGADAAPYFRVFNPVLQGQKFDPDGAYVRRWAPELARLPTQVIHAPWTARPIDLSAAGVALGLDYPHPVVDHGHARERALAALQSISAAGEADQA